MQAAGIILGGATFLYVAIAAVHLARQSRDQNRRNELSIELLKRQLETAELQKDQLEQERLSWNGYRLSLIHI